MRTQDDMESDRAVRLKKVLVRMTAGIAMISLLYSAYLYYDYRARMPTEPQPNAGRTYPVDLKGDTFYTTKTEQRRYYATLYIFWASVITIVATGWVRWRRSHSRAV